VANKRDFIYVEDLAGLTKQKILCNLGNFIP